MALKLPRIKNDLVKCFLAEVLGTYMMMLIGLASVAQVVLGDGDIFSINTGWFFAVTIGLYCSLSVSGGHLNPAVTIAVAILRGLSWRKVPVYLVGQYLGSFLAAASVYGVYEDGINKLEVDGQRSMVTAKIFATYPKHHVTSARCFLDQIFGTGILLLGIVAVSEEKKTRPQDSVFPLIIGGIVFAVGTSFAYNCGYAINPARDLSPRLFTLIAGWGTEVFSYRNYNWFWVPIFGPHVGAILGVLVYDLFVGHHGNGDDEDSEEEMQPKISHHMGVYTLPQQGTVTSQPEVKVTASSSS
ncbi:aquaporin-7-like [Argonauta hians]